MDLHVDIIVNAANKELEGGGGVCGAIHAAAGEQLYAACARLHGCRTGDVKATPEFCLQARHIFHAVGPREGEDISLLASCYRRALDLAKTMSLRTIAFPCISTGIYGVDRELAADTALREVCSWLYRGTNMDSMDKIIFAFHLRADERLYIDRWSRFVEAPPPAMIRTIGAAAPGPPLRTYTGTGVTCGWPPCTLRAPTPAQPPPPTAPLPVTYHACSADNGAHHDGTDAASSIDASSSLNAAGSID